MVTIYTFDDTVFLEVQKSLNYDGEVPSELISKKAHSETFTLKEYDTMHK